MFSNFYLEDFEEKFLNIEFCKDKLSPYFIKLIGNNISDDMDLEYDIELIVRNRAKIYLGKER